MSPATDLALGVGLLGAQLLVAFLLRDDFRRTWGDRGRAYLVLFVLAPWAFMAHLWMQRPPQDQDQDQDRAGGPPAA
jgi:hypothetical protein